jgi:hypothetical protein
MGCGRSLRLRMRFRFRELGKTRPALDGFEFLFLVHDETRKIVDDFSTPSAFFS